MGRSQAEGSATVNPRWWQRSVYALAPFRRQLAFPDGSKRIREFKAGDVAWMPAQSHVGENVGSTSTDALLVEVKPR